MLRRNRQHRFKYSFLNQVDAELKNYILILTRLWMVRLERTETARKKVSEILDIDPKLVSFFSTNDKECSQIAMAIRFKFRGNFAKYKKRECKYSKIESSYRRSASDNIKEILQKDI